MSCPSLPAQFARSLSGLSFVRGWPTVANALAGRRGSFETDIGGARFAGNLASFIDRQAYLFNGYEGDLIRLFLSRVPRGGTVLDVGANVGNHSVLFATHFDRVLAFEPNPGLLAALERNIALNGNRSIELYPLGLSDASGELELFNIDNGNLGLATFLAEEQYDQPLQAVTTVRVEAADELLGDISVSAVKIDVQGFEPQVLRGMRDILARNRPVVWTEFGLGTLIGVATRADVEALFPYPITIERFEVVRGALTARHVLRSYDAMAMTAGDFLVRPA